MGGSGRGSGLEAEQAGDGSPSEPTVLKEVELPEPLGEAMLGAAGAVFPACRILLCVQLLFPDFSA